MTRQIGISQVRGVVGNIPGKGGSQGSPLPGERAHAVSAQLKSPPCGWHAQCERRTGERGTREPDHEGFHSRLRNCVFTFKVLEKNRNFSSWRVTQLGLILRRASIAVWKRNARDAGRGQKWDLRNHLRSH